MKARQTAISRLTWLPALLAIYVPRSSAIYPDDRAPAAAFGGFLWIFLICGLAAYVYLALAVQTIAQKTNTENPWLAWIPLINIVLLLNIAKKPLWWFLLLLIPIVNIVVSILVWMAVAEARNRPNWWGILMIVPVVNLIVPGYLAWAD
jgi:hypothetical protein